MTMVLAGEVSAQQPQPAPAQPQAPVTAAPAQPTAPAGQPPAREPETREPTRQGRSGRVSRREPREAAQPMSGSITDARFVREGGPVTRNTDWTTTLVGGYDDNLVGAPGADLPGGVTPDAMPSGSVSTIDSALAFYQGNSRHSLRLDATGRGFYYPQYLDGVVPGATANLAVTTTLGLKTKVDASQAGGYDPFFSTFAPDSAGVPLPPDVDQAVSSAGLFERQSWTSRSQVGLTQQWTRRMSMTASYAYGLRDFADGPEGDNTSHTAAAGYRHVLSDSLRLRGDYTYADLESLDPDGFARPNTTERIEGGFDGEHEVSRTRLVSWTLTAGVARVESVSGLDRLPFTDSMPVGTATLRVPVSATWYVEGRYTRDFRLLQTVTSELYAANTGLLTLGGMLGRDTTLQAIGSYGDWKTPVASGVTSTLEVLGVALQLQHMLTDTFGLFGSYSYYNHRYTSPGALPDGFPPRYDRNSVRLGITVRLPLAGNRQSQSVGRQVP
jgi:hypothetical protein